MNKENLSHGFCGASSRFFPIAMTIALALLTTTGCQKDNENRFTATIQDFNSAKDHIVSNMAYWNNGDRVKINNGTYTISLDGDNRATIAADNVTTYGGNYYAAYPANQSSIGTDGTISFDIPNNEKYTTSGGYQLTHNIMAAKTNGEQLAFENMGAMLHFKLKASANGSGNKLRAIEVITDRPLSGKLSVRKTGSDWTTSLSATAADSSRMLLFDTPLELSTSANDLYLLVPAVEGASWLRLRIVIENGNTIKVFDKKKEVATSFTREYIYHFQESVLDCSNNTMNFGDNISVSPLNMDGTASHPYLVSSGSIWNSLSSSLNTSGKHVVLTNDIDVSARTTTLKATLDGNGHTITLTSNNISLFETIEGGTVCNLTIDATSQINISSAQSSTNNRFGALACYAKSGAVIRNCVNKADIKCLQGKQSTMTVVGGICGRFDGSSIVNCRNDASIETDACYAGSIAGQCSGVSSIDNCTNSGDLTINIASGEDKQIKAGTLWGDVSLSGTNITVIDCHNSGTITIKGSTSNDIYLGGLFGRISASSQFTVKDCSNKGNIVCNATVNSTKKTYVGGISGMDGNQASTMINCYNEGNISKSASANNIYAGGLLGYDKYMSIKNCYAFCNITAKESAGIVCYGPLQVIANIDRCYYFGEIDATSPHGIAGSSDNSTYHFALSNCFCPNQYSTFCGSYGTTSNCETIANPNSDYLKDKLNTGKPDNYRDWIIGSTHLVLDYSH